VLRRDLEAALLQRLELAGNFVTTVREEATLADARRATWAYLEAPTSLERQAEAYAMLTALVDLNVAQARVSNDESARWDELATTVGIVAGILVFLLTGSMLWWLRTRAFQPMFRLADTMTRFGRGARDARAPERGPAEIRAMAAQFNAMANDLAVQQSAQTAFIGGIAHDLRNPVAAMRMTVEALAEGGDAVDPVRVERAIARLQRNLSRVNRMIDDFLDVARMEAGELQLERQPCDVRAIVADTIAQFDGQSGLHPVHASYPAEPLVTSGDPMRLEQALGNLIGNAIKYSPEGASVDVDVRALAAEAAVVIEVVDHGVGMSEEDRRNLFQPFRRGGSAAGTPGVGLGLFVTRRIVEAHGGAIEVESRPGHGSLFRVKLPAT